MLRLTLLWVGKTKHSWIKQGLDHYINRLSHYLKVDVIEVKEKGSSGRASPELMMRHEAEAITKILPKGNVHLIVLDRRGKKITSPELASLITTLEEQGKRDLVWIIGGPYGLDPLILKMADLSLSLSHLTFTHDMIRLILAEQLYRACTIRNNEGYHH